MKREATEIARSEDGKIAIYVDVLNAEGILAYLDFNSKRRKHWKTIKGVILGRLKNDCYKREIVGDIRDVHAMRFDLHAQNGRIYCKQISKADMLLIVIMSELHVSKKSEGLSHKEITLIKKVHSYEYDI